MGYTTNNGYVPDSFNDIYQGILDQENVYVYNTPITMQEFQGSAEGNVAYANAQTLMNLENKFAQVYEKMRAFVQTSNAKISVLGVSYYPLKRILEQKTGLVVSIAEPTNTMVGLYIAFDYDDTGEGDENRPVIADSIFRYKAAGVITYGSISYDVPIDDAKAATINWEAAAHKDADGEQVAGRGEIEFRVTIRLSRNSSTSVDTTQEIADKFIANYNELCGIGQDIEPEAYFEINRDAPYASEIITEYLTDDGSWTDEVKQVEYWEAYNAVLPDTNITFV